MKELQNHIRRYFGNTALVYAKFNNKTAEKPEWRITAWVSKVYEENKQDEVGTLSHALLAFFPKKTLLNGNKCISFRTMLHYSMVPLTVVYRNTSCWWSTEVWFLLFFKAHRHKGSTLHHQTGRTPAMAFSCNDNWKATVWPKGPNADHSGRIRLESPETWLRSYCSTLHHHSVFVTAPRAIVKPLKHIV